MAKLVCTVRKELEHSKFTYRGMYKLLAILNAHSSSELHVYPYKLIIEMIKCQVANLKSNLELKHVWHFIYFSYSVGMTVFEN